ncbi:phosphoribosyltransferase [Sphingobium sp. KCTC 72723]|uniref:phosphoribosyltransferase n=1 Tax=Sphingobium sp. KCTC 72723 TaxID=2733867 RepID=UPI00165E8CC0|nr:phosphoribosyltransferase [Sphingobium sp. KCTC 72723]
MSLMVHSYCGYPSYEGLTAWNGSDHDAHMFVQTLKGRAINGYVTLRKPSGPWVRFTTETPQPAFDIWSEWAGALALRLLPGGGLIVPVPSSDCLAIGADAKGKKLADHVALRAPGFTVAEALHWEEQWQKASEGGPRDPGILFENIRVEDALPKHEVILIDDVATTGGHLITAARAMRWAGHRVRFAICAASTVKTRPERGIFTIATRDLEADPLEL